MGKDRLPARPLGGCLQAERLIGPYLEKEAVALADAFFGEQNCFAGGETIRPNALELAKRRRAASSQLQRPARLGDGGRAQSF